MSLTLTVRQLLDLVALAGYDTNTLHAQTEQDEFDTELTVEPCPPAGLCDDDGEALHYSLIAYFTEYPEEGALGLGHPILAPMLSNQTSLDIASTSKPVFADSDCDGGSRAGYACSECGQSDCNGDCMGDGLMGGAA